MLGKREVREGQGKLGKGRGSQGRVGEGKLCQGKGRQEMGRFSLKNLYESRPSEWFQRFHCEQVFTNICLNNYFSVILQSLRLTYSTLTLVVSLYNKLTAVLHTSMFVLLYSQYACKQPYKIMIIKASDRSLKIEPSLYRVSQ